MRERPQRVARHQQGKLRMINYGRRTSLAAIALCLAASATSVWAGDTPEARSKAAARYLSIVPTSKMFDEVASKVANAKPTDQRASFLRTVTDQSGQDALDREAREVMIKIFTAEELNALADFYGSPVGMSAMKKMQKYSAEMLPFVMQTIRASAQRAVLSSSAPPPATPSAR
jgi:hypothetical protein